jgi:hypothetical protein
MFILKVVPTVFLFLLLQLSVQVQFPPDQAYALCCAKCGSLTCGLCSCPGVNGCPTCLSDDTNIVHPSTLVDKATMDIRAARNLDATDRVMHLTNVGDCARRSFALRVLGNAGDSLKVEPFSFSVPAIKDSAEALQITAKAE